jgi:hypothetical protein
MSVRYSGHMVRTRQQAAWLGIILLVVLLPLAARRFTMEPPGAALALALLTLAPFMLAYECWRFLREQERLHPEPTPEMAFVFRCLANTPLTFGALLFVVLVAIN